MSLELVNAIASVIAALVITATAIAAIIQLRHMRMNNQITALLIIQDEFDAKDYRDADALIRSECPAIFNDEGFCAYMVAVLGDQQPVESARYLEARRAARLVANTYENLGTLVKRGIIDKDIFLDVYSWIIALAWSNLESFVAMVREALGEQSLYQNFEYIASISQDYLATNPVTYPRNTKRLIPHLSSAAARVLSEKTPASG